MTLHEFLTARLEEEDRLADDMLGYQKHRLGEVDPIDVNEPAHGMWVYDDDRMHDTIAIYELRLKREIAAKRAILSEHEDAEYLYKHDSEAPDAVAALRIVVRHMAAVYTDHPDYQQKWAP